MVYTIHTLIHGIPIVKGTGFLSFDQFSRVRLGNDVVECNRRNHPHQNQRTPLKSRVSPFFIWNLRCLHLWAKRNAPLRRRRDKAPERRWAVRFRYRRALLIQISMSRSLSSCSASPCPSKRYPILFGTDFFFFRFPWWNLIYRFHFRFVN